MKNTANVILTVLAVFIFCFIITMIITFWKFQVVPDTLIQYTLGAGGVECLVLAGIKVSKVVTGYKKNDGDEEEEDLSQ